MIKSYLKIVGVFWVFGLLAVSRPSLADDSDKALPDPPEAATSENMGAQIVNPSNSSGADVNPQGSALSPASTSLPNLLNPVSTQRINIDALNKAGIYPLSGTLFIDRNVNANIVNVSSMTVSSITVATHIQVPNGVASTDAAAFGQVGGTGGKNAAGYIIGSVVQVITGNSSTIFTTPSNNYQITNLTASITPKSSTHKIMVMAESSIGGGGSTTVIEASLFRDSTNISINSVGTAFFNISASAAWEVPCSLLAWDSPASTSAITYSVKLRSTDNATTAKFGADAGQLLVLVEVAQ